MKITLTEAGKRFNRDWIFRHVSYEFINGHSYAITGPNGSGKSTLLQVIAGAVSLSEGSLKYELTGNNKSLTRRELTDGGSQLTGQYSLSTVNRHLSSENIYRHISIATPYLELVEEMTLIEFLHFHQQFKPFLSSVDTGKIISLLGLEKSAHKQIRYYSSGMKQRVKLAQAVFSDTPVVLLDEPCTNLDKEGIDLYLQLIENYCKGRLIVVSSNDEQEYGFCGETISMMDYKK